MKQTEAIHTALKRLMRSRGRTYAQAARVLELSEASVKRLFSRAELSLERLETLCDWLDVDIGDVVSMSAEVTPLLTELDARQEQELLRDPALLLIAFLTLNRWSEAEILETFNFKKVDLLQKLRRLERLGLIELMPFDRIKIRAARNFAWRKDGPIQKYFAERVLPEFLATRFDEPGERMHFVGGMLTRASILKMHELMDSLAHQLDELVAQDLGLPIKERYGVSLFMGLRPWEFSEFTKLRRKPREKYF
jgi:DNA-binding Xre family transcriptional regulator